MSEVTNCANLHSATAGFEDRAKALNDDKYWLALAEAKKNQWRQAFLTRLDNTIGKMPLDENREVNQKFNRIIPARAKCWKEQYDEGFLDILIEILGWGWLSERYSSSVINFRNTPDLEVLDDQGSIVAAMECKNFLESKRERDYHKSIRGNLKNIEAREVDQRLISNDPAENPFLWKLMCVLCKAEEQLNMSGLQDNKFVFINFDFDDSSLVQIDGTKVLLGRLANVLKGRGVEFVAFQGYDVGNSLVE